MPTLFKSTHFARRKVAFAAVSLLSCAVLTVPVCGRPDEPSFDTVGAIDGEDILVSGSMRMEFEHGHAKTILRSGSDVRVKSGQARIELVEGGKIIICGPAHFSVLKSADSLTLALDFGVIHAHIAREPALVIYTAQIQAKPVAIGESAQDVLVGIDAAGAICIRAASGAVRLEQQLTGQSVIVPQNGDVLLANGQLDTLRTVAGHCSCELQVAKAPPAPPPSPEVSAVAITEDSQKKQSEAKALASQPAPQKPLATQGPIYQVFMPPLAYDAAALQVKTNPYSIACATFSTVSGRVAPSAVPTYLGKYFRNEWPACSDGSLRPTLGPNSWNGTSHLKIRKAFSQ